MPHPILSKPLPCHDCGKMMEVAQQPRLEGGYITLFTCWNPLCLLKGVTLSEARYGQLTEADFEAYRAVNRLKVQRGMRLRDIPPTLGEWHGTKRPRIRTVQSLTRSISPSLYDGVYWIAETVDNRIVEYHLLTDWHFTDSGQLVGRVTTSQKQTVEIKPEEYVILNVV